MSDYRRYFVPGGTYFFTIVTYKRQHLFASGANVQRLRRVIATVKKDVPFKINAAIILPDHMHFLWTLPPGDDQYSKRIGCMKVGFTNSLHGENVRLIRSSSSRTKHRESDVWQRRFWEHTIRDEEDFDRHFDYIHYNPVKHGLVSCPHAWEASSFHHWVVAGVYDRSWGCNCGDRRRTAKEFDFADIEDSVGE